MTKQEKIERAVDELAHLDPGDPEAAHNRADDVLCMYLRATGSRAVAEAFERARERCGFWYA